MIGSFISTGNMPNNYPSMVSLLKLNLNRLPKPIFIQTLAPDLQDMAVDNGWCLTGLMDKDSYLSYVRSSEILIGHCGVGFLKDCINNARRAYFLPRSSLYQEHIDDHQYELVEIIEKYQLGNIILTPKPIFFDKCQLLDALDFELNFCDLITLSGSFICVSSVGGHLSETIETSRKLNNKGSKLLKIIVDERTPFLSVDCLTIKYNNNKYINFLFSLLHLIWIIIKLNPDFIVSHGAGFGFVGAIAGKMMGRKVYLCESITRVYKPGRWFRAAFILGFDCFAPSTAKFINESYYSKVKVVPFRIIKYIA